MDSFISVIAERDRGSNREISKGSTRYRDGE